MDINAAVEAGTRSGTTAANDWLDTVHPPLDDLRSALSPTSRQFSWDAQDEERFEEAFGYGHQAPIIDAFYAAYDAAALKVVEDTLARLAWLMKPLPEPGSTKRAFTPTGQP